MSNSKLITLDLLQQFSEKCKQTFSPAHKQANAAGNQFILKFGANLDAYTTEITFSGIDGADYLNSTLYYNSSDNLVVNKGNITIRDAWVYRSSTYSLIYLTLSTALTVFTAEYFVVKGDLLVNCLTDFMSSSFTSPTGCVAIHILNDNRLPQLVSFSVVDSNDQKQSYPSVTSFDSISAAGKVENVTFMLGDSSDNITVDVAKNTTIALPAVKYAAGNNVTIDDNNEISVDIPDASESNKGLVQIGSGITCENGVISAELETATASTLGGVKVNGIFEEDKNPVNIDANGYIYTKKEDPHRFTTMPAPTAEWSGKIVEYIGKTTDFYTQGYFYICFPTLDISIPCLQEIDPGESTGALFAKYVYGKTWESGELVDINDFVGTWSFVYDNVNLKLFNSERAFLIPKEDFKKFNMLLKEDVNLSGVSYFLNSDIFNWEQKNVLPIAYLDGLDLEFMTDADTDSIFADPVTEFKILDEDENEIPEDFGTTKSELILWVFPSEFVYSYLGNVQLSYNEKEQLVLLVNGNGQIYFKSVIYPEVTKTINIIKNEEAL